MSAPCAGCPPCCANCIFDPQGVETNGEIAPVMPQEQYGCIHGGSLVNVTVAGIRVASGLLRKGVLHPLKEAGMRFLQESNNPLASQLTAVA